jgi:flagellin
MYIQNNTSAMNALNNMGTTEVQLTSSIQKLSSGFRLNRAGDDAAGMSIANSLRNNESGLLAAQQNASQAGSVLQIADGATQTISTILDRMKQLATESASSNVTDTDRQKIQAEFAQLQSEIDRTVGSTVYQGQTLLGGGFGAAVSNTSAIVQATSSAPAGASNIVVGGAKASTTYTLAYASNKLTMTDAAGNAQVLAATSGAGVQNFNFDKLGISFTFNGDVSDTTNGFGSGSAKNTIVTTASAPASFRVGSGATNDADNTISLSLSDISTTGLGLTAASVSVGTAATAQTALASISAAVTTLNATIGTIGAAESRLGYATTNLNSLYQNVSAAESVIRDTNMAQEYTNYSKLQIMQQAGTAMLAQANSSQQSVLKLFQ